LELSRIAESLLSFTTYVTTYPSVDRIESVTYWVYLFMSGYFGIDRTSKPDENLPELIF